MLLRHATVDEQNAAYNELHRQLVPLIAQLPGFIQGQATQHLNSPEGVKQVIRIINAVLDAAEAVREKHEAKA
jgi:antibiotic biosynthesis monooxygenase (ABM) superfamily enzyme